MNVIHYFKRHACLVAAFLLLVGQAVFSSAQTILIDFGNNVAQYRGIAVPNPDPNGHFWNSVQPGLLVPNLIDFTGAVTPTQLAWDTPVGTDSYNGPAGATDIGTPASNLHKLIYDKVALGNLGVDEAVFDYATGPNSPDPVTGNKTRFQLQGLDPTLKYDLTFYGSQKYSFDPTTIYSIYTDSTYTTLAGTANLNVRDLVDPSAHNEDQVATITGVTPTSSTILYVQFVGNTGDKGYLEDMQIAANGVAPQPTGDYNGNGKVDAADYIVWRNHLGQTFSLPNRDPLNGSGPVSAADYNSWKAHFGATGAGSGAGVSGSGAVPEPSTILLSVLAFVGLAGCVKRR